MLYTFQFPNTGQMHPPNASKSHERNYLPKNQGHTSTGGFQVNHRSQGSVQAKHGWGRHTYLAEASCSWLGKPTRTTRTYSLGSRQALQRHLPLVAVRGSLGTLRQSPPPCLTPHRPCTGHDALSLPRPSPWDWNPGSPAPRRAARSALCTASCELKLTANWVDHAMEALGLQGISAITTLV